MKFCYELRVILIKDTKSESDLIKNTPPRSININNVLSKSNLDTLSLSLSHCCSTIGLSQILD